MAEEQQLLSLGLCYARGIGARAIMDRRKWGVYLWWLVLCYGRAKMGGAGDSERALLHGEFFTRDVEKRRTPPEL